MALVVAAADQDFADDEPQDALLAGGVELVQAAGEAAEEALEPACRRGWPDRAAQPAGVASARRR